MPLVGAMPPLLDLLVLSTAKYAGSSKNLCYIPQTVKIYKTDSLFGAENIFQGSAFAPDGLWNVNKK